MLRSCTPAPCASPYYRKLSRHQLAFVNYAIKKKSRNFSDVENKCRELNMRQKLSNVQGKNQEKNTFSLSNSLLVQKTVKCEVNCQDVNVDLR